MLSLITSEKDGATYIIYIHNLVPSTSISVVYQAYPRPEVDVQERLCFFYARPPSVAWVASLLIATGYF